MAAFTSSGRSWIEKIGGMKGSNRPQGDIPSLRSNEAVMKLASPQFSPGATLELKISR
jgi:hypothetical protein